MHKDVTEEMIDQEIARQDYMRRAGIMQVEGRVVADFPFFWLAGAIVVGNLVTALVVGLIFLVVSTLMLS